MFAAYERSYFMCVSIQKHAGRFSFLAIAMVFSKAVYAYSYVKAQNQLHDLFSKDQSIGLEGNTSHPCSWKFTSIPKAFKKVPKGKFY